MKTDSIITLVILIGIVLVVFAFNLALPIAQLANTVTRATLARLARTGSSAERPRVLCTSIDALLQRTPPRSFTSEAVGMRWAPVPPVPKLREVTAAVVAWLSVIPVVLVRAVMVVPSGMPVP